MEIKIKEFWEKHETKIVLTLGFVLVAVLSFEAGVLKGQKSQQNPVIVKADAQSGAVCGMDSGNASEAQNLPSDGQNNSPSPSAPAPNPPQNCAFVGSKNSNKYHLPSCQWAKRIKPENITCFKDKNEAESKGYLPDKNCIK